MASKYVARKFVDQSVGSLSEIACEYYGEEMDDEIGKMPSGHPMSLEPVHDLHFDYNFPNFGLKKRNFPY